MNIINNGQNKRKYNFFFKNNNMCFSFDIKQFEQILIKNYEFCIRQISCTRPMEG